MPPKRDGLIKIKNQKILETENQYLEEFRRIQKNLEIFRKVQKNIENFRKKSKGTS